MSDQLSRAIAFATIYHSGQKDKNGVHYILHPLRMMFNMKTEKEKIVALLHDVLEDTDATEEEIREYFGSEILEAVVAMTRLESETYMEYVERAAKNPIAREVKKEDMRDQLLPERRIPETKGLEKRYSKALAYINKLEETE